MAADKKSVFISYSSQDSKFVNKVLALLDKIGISYWKAPEMIPAGSSYAREIPRAIRECEVFLVILSKYSQESIWVEKEIDSAICYRKSIVPLKIDQMPLNETFQFYLNNVQTISYAKDPELAFQMLQEQLNMICMQDGVGSGRKWTNEPEIQGENIIRIERDVVSKQRMRRDGLSLNRIPVECGHCGGSLQQISRGTYRCKDCGSENYDDFQLVRRYLERAGATPAVVIERETGVPRKTIQSFLRDEYLEIPKLSEIRIVCENCGAAIRTGYLCEQCKKGNYSSKMNHSDIFLRYTK